MPDPHLVEIAMRLLRRSIAALSLLLCLAMIAAWIISYQYGLGFTLGARRPDIWLTRGEWMLADAHLFHDLISNVAPPPRPPFGRLYRLAPVEQRIPLNSFLGFSWHGSRWGPVDVLVSVPHWFFTLVFAIPPAVFLLPRRRPKPGHCQKCGYDLRASPIRCPACGTPIASGGPAP